jgi:hypothetical protein
MPLSSHFLYICASDGSIHVFASDIEAKLGVISSISADESRLEVINFMQTVSFKNQLEAVQGAPMQEALQQYIICCTNNNIKLLTSGSKGVESLLSLRTAEPIRLAFLVCSPHLIEQRDDTAKVKSPTPTDPTPSSAPARELCLAIVDTKAVLTVYSVQLKILFSTQLRMDARSVSEHLETHSPNLHAIAAAYVLASLLLCHSVAYLLSPSRCPRMVAWRSSLRARS